MARVFSTAICVKISGQITNKNCRGKQMYATYFFFYKIFICVSTAVPNNWATHCIFILYLADPTDVACRTQNCQTRKATSIANGSHPRYSILSQVWTCTNSRISEPTTNGSSMQQISFHRTGSWYCTNVLLCLVWW